MMIDIKEMELKIEKTIALLKDKLKGIRTGRASVEFLAPVQVMSYGSKTPIGQVGTVSVLDPKTLCVQVWDKSLVKATEKAIVDANLGLNPVSDGQMIRMNVPALSAERRKELIKIVHKYSEDAKIAIRSLRKAANDTIKAQEKSAEISKDDMYKKQESIQKSIDKHIKDIDSYILSYEKKILQ